MYNKTGTVISPYQSFNLRKTAHNMTNQRLHFKQQVRYFRHQSFQKFDNLPVEMEIFYASFTTNCYLVNFHILSKISFN
jgi:hypothetical protein